MANLSYSSFDVAEFT